MAPFDTKRPPSPFGQKPRSSRNSIGVIVKASYSDSIFTSDGFRPAILKAWGPDSAAAVTVRSGMLEIVACPMDSPTPSTYAAVFFIDLARAAEVSMIAPPPSVTRQQSRTVNG